VYRCFYLQYILSDILYLDDNSFWGTIPTELQGLQNLRELSLFENQLTGTVPTELGVLFKLEVLALNANNIGGTIPNSLAQLPNLSELNCFLWCCVVNLLVQLTRTFIFLSPFSVLSHPMNFV
jgi:hypothetical protein